MFSNLLNRCCKKSINLYKIIEQQNKNQNRFKALNTMRVKEQ